MKTPIDFSGLASLFDPKVEAEGAALLARTKNFDSESRLNDQRAGLIGDRRAALGNDSALLAAGYTPRQIAAMRATQTDSMADLFGGVRADTGTQSLLGGGDPRKAAILLNHSQALEPDAAFNEIQAGNLRREKAAADRAKAVEVAQAAAKARAGAKGSGAAGANGDDKPNLMTFTPDQLNGPVRQAIVDMYHAGSKDTGDFVTLDEGAIQRIMNTAQSLIQNGVSTRSSALADAFAVNGYSTSSKADERFSVTTEKTDKPGLWTGDFDKVTGITPVPQAAADPVEWSNGEDPVYDIPAEQIPQALPMIRDQAPVGAILRLGNRLYQKVQGQDGSFFLQAVSN